MREKRTALAVRFLYANVGEGLDPPLGKQSLPPLQIAAQMRFAKGGSRPSPTIEIGFAALFKKDSKSTLLTFLALSGIVCLALKGMEC